MQGVVAPIIAIVLLAALWVLPLLLLSSAKARLRRAREAAETLTEDVTVLVGRGEVDRALQAAGSHETVFARAVSRVLTAQAERRTVCARELDDAWKARPSGVPGAWHELATAALGLSGLLGLVLMTIGAFTEDYGTFLDRVGYCVVILLPGPAFVLVGLGARMEQIRAERRGLASTYRDCLGRVTSALDAPRPGTPS